MNEEKVNIAIRKFLKKVGINAQREIERIIREEADAVQDVHAMRVKMTLNIEGKDIQTIEDAIDIG